MADVEKFNQTFDLVEGLLGQYGDYTFEKDVTNVSGNDIQRLTEITLDYDPELIKITYNLETIAGKWWVAFTAVCPEKDSWEMTLSRKNVSDNEIKSVLNSISTSFDSYMGEVYNGKKWVLISSEQKLIWTIIIVQYRIYHT